MSNIGKISQYELDNELFDGLNKPRMTFKYLNNSSSKILLTSRKFDGTNSDLNVGIRYNYKTDELIVFKNRKYIKLNKDYRFSNDTNTKITEADSGTIRNGDIFSFIAYSNSRNSVHYYEGLVSNNENRNFELRDSRNSKLYLVFRDGIYLSSDHYRANGTKFETFYDGKYDIITFDKESPEYRKIPVVNNKINIKNIGFDRYSDSIILFSDSYGNMLPNYDYRFNEDYSEIIFDSNKISVNYVFTYIFKNKFAENLFKFDSNFRQSTDTIKIEDSKFDRFNDSFLIFADGKYIEEDADYTLSYDNKYIKISDTYRNTKSFTLYLIKDGKKNGSVVKNHLRLTKKTMKLKTNLFFEPDFDRDNLLIFWNGYIYPETEYMFFKDTSECSCITDKLNRPYGLGNEISIVLLRNTKCTKFNSETPQSSGNSFEMKLEKCQPELSNDDVKFLIFNNRLYDHNAKYQIRISDANYLTGNVVTRDSVYNKTIAVTSLYKSLNNLYVKEYDVQLNKLSDKLLMELDYLTQYILDTDRLIKYCTSNNLMLRKQFEGFQNSLDRAWQ